MPVRLLDDVQPSICQACRCLPPSQVLLFCGFKDMSSLPHQDKARNFQKYMSACRPQYGRGLSGLVQTVAYQWGGYTQISIDHTLQASLVNPLCVSSPLKPVSPHVPKLGSEPELARDLAFVLFLGATPHQVPQWVPDLRQWFCHTCRGWACQG